MIAVLGATGNIGSKLANALLDRGEKIRVMARNENKLQALKERGAEIVVGDIAHREDLTELFRDADSAFIMIPPAYSEVDMLGYMKSVSETLVSALRSSSVQNIVSLSSLGAHRDSYVGPVRGLHEHEKRVAQLRDKNVLTLRPTYFMENFLGNIALIQDQKINGGGIKKGVKFPAIAAQDIAEEAAARLIARDFKGHSIQDLLGAEDLDVESATKAFAEALNIPNLPYIEFSYPDVKQALLSFGFSNQAADLMVELTEGVNLSKFNEIAKRDARNTTKTTFPEFLKLHLTQAQRAQV